MPHCMFRFTEQRKESSPSLQLGAVTSHVRRLNCSYTSANVCMEQLINVTWRAPNVHNLWDFIGDRREDNVWTRENLTTSWEALTLFPAFDAIEMQKPKPGGLAPTTGSYIIQWTPLPTVQRIEPVINAHSHVSGLYRMQFINYTRHNAHGPWTIIIYEQFVEK